MSLQEIKTDIQKCSKCGLCMSVCPVFNETSNDCNVLRGLFIILKGIIEGSLTLNKNTKKHLDLCLKCNACKQFCPTNIDARSIIQTAEEEYYSTHKTPILNFCIIALFNTIMNLIKICSFLYRLLYFDKIIKKIYPLLLKSKFGKDIILLNTVLERSTIKKKNINKNTDKKIKVVYFEGCFNKYINPKIKIATKILLDKMGVEILPVDFTCCGISFLNDGNIDLFLEFAKRNLSKIPDNFDYFLTDCASCKYAFSMYEKYIKDEKLLNKIKDVNSKSISVNDFITNNTENFEFKNNISFTFHKPCHEENIDFIDKFLAKSNNINYVQLDNFDSCCGFSGTFALKHRELSKKISKTKTKNIINSNINNIITTCPACIMGINQGLIENNNTNSFSKHFIEFLVKNTL